MYSMLSEDQLPHVDADLVWVMEFVLCLAQAVLMVHAGRQVPKQLPCLFTRSNVSFET